MAGKETISDRTRNVAASNPGREIHSGMDTAGVTKAHMDTFKFDKEADTAAQNETNAGPVYDIGGELTKPTADAQRIRHAARVAAQMKSHKNPRNRVS